MSDIRTADEVRRDRWDALAAIVLALAAVLSAWAAYQSTRWSGEQANAYAESSALRASAQQHETRASRQIQIDVATFLAWTEAALSDNGHLADQLHARFRPEFVPAFDAWLATSTADGQLPSGTPFERAEYAVAEQTAATADLANAQAAFDSAGHANQISDNFVLVAVIFASVLFMAGIASRFDQHRIRMGLAIVAALLFAVGAVAEFVLPQDVGL